MLDRFLAAVLLVLLLPLMAGVAIAVWVGLGRGVLFRQQRVGHGGRHFTVLKFRTMRHGAAPNPGDGGMEVCSDHGHKCPNDPRHTRVGSLFRKLSLDELPQLLNVLRGEMSLVGPRPELPEIVARYEPWQHDRHRVKPGLTGLWQVTERGNGLVMWQSTRADIDYVERVSFLTDLLILMRTPAALLGRQRGS